jgi:16S rRNA (cytidine1402-2'-O)-methyltransferase
MGNLYVVGTPIGNLEDVTLRALRVLGEVDLVAAEDTRVTSRLLQRHGLRRPMLSYRAPVEVQALPRLLQALDRGDVALVSDAGTPTLSDPGRRLVAAAWEAGHRVVPVPGPSAVTAAAAISGIAGDALCFAGFLPRKSGQLRRFFEALRDARQATVAFESPHRIAKSLGALAEVLPDRQLALCRELTKVHEEVVRGTASEILAALEGRFRGEITLVIASA